MLAFVVNLLLLSFLLVAMYGVAHISFSGLLLKSTPLKFRWLKNLTAILIFDYTLITALLLGNHFEWWVLEGFLYKWLQSHLILDIYSIVYFTLTCFISLALIRFSSHYLYRDRWVAKFYLNLIIFVSSLMVASLANRFVVFIVAWELVGLTSIFLIAYYQDREATVKNAFRTLVSYKIGDLCLYLAMIRSAQYGVTSFEQIATVALPQWIYVLFLIAAMVKSAQYPFSYWLPRAMEGPTPTSAVFYGSVSVHLGIFLLLRVLPSEMHTIGPLVILVGVITLLHSSFVGRTIPDIKKSYAYATMSQLAIMFIELGLGFKTLVLVHLCSHSILRFYQFLQVPSILQRRHKLEARIQKSLHGRDAFFDYLISKRFQNFLYYFSFDEGKLHFIRKKFVVRPVRLLSTFLVKCYSPIFSKIEVFESRAIVKSLFILSILGLGLNCWLEVEETAATYKLIILIVALTISISMFSENELSRLFSKVFFLLFFVYFPFVTSYRDPAAPTLVALHFIFLYIFYVLLSGLARPNAKGRVFVYGFLGLFEFSNRQGRWAILLLLLSVGAPLSPVFFLAERVTNFYLDQSLTIGFLFCLTNLFVVLSLFRFSFLLLFGPSDNINAHFLKSSIYVSKQYRTDISEERTKDSQLLGNT